VIILLKDVEVSPLSPSAPAPGHPPGTLHSSLQANDPYEESWAGLRLWQSVSISAMTAAMRASVEILQIELPLLNGVFISFNLFQNLIDCPHLERLFRVMYFRVF
jgi:hypothetical protein